MNPATENDVSFYALMVCAVTVSPHWFAAVFWVLAVLVLIRDARQQGGRDDA